MVESTGVLRALATFNTGDSGMVEEGAMALFTIYASTILTRDVPITMVTDSQSACRIRVKGMVIILPQTLLLFYSSH